IKEKLVDDDILPLLGDLHLKWYFYQNCEEAPNLNDVTQLSPHVHRLGRHRWTHVWRKNNRQGVWRGKTVFDILWLSPSDRGVRRQSSRAAPSKRFSLHAHSCQGCPQSEGALPGTFGRRESARGTGWLFWDPAITRAAGIAGGMQGLMLKLVITQTHQQQSQTNPIKAREDKASGSLLTATCQLSHSYLQEFCAFSLRKFRPEDTNRGRKKALRNYSRAEETMPKVKTDNGQKEKMVEAAHVCWQKCPHLKVSACQLIDHWYSCTRMLQAAGTKQLGFACCRCSPQLWSGQCYLELHSFWIPFSLIPSLLRCGNRSGLIHWSVAAPPRRAATPGTREAPSKAGAPRC
ncbi:hypothetical protein Nmel_006624, partial [Mimus melanotis]